MKKIMFPKSDFDHYCTCPSEMLEAEISRSMIRLKLQDVPQTEQERSLYQESTDRIVILKNISLLRQKKITPEQFNQKAEIL